MPEPSRQLAAGPPERLEDHPEIEDLDGPRVKPGAGDGLLEDLRWLGSIGMKGRFISPAEQTFIARLSPTWLQKGMAYPCTCSRREAESASSAPHAEDGASVYPGTCRGRYPDLAAAREASGREPRFVFLCPPEKSNRATTFAAPCGSTPPASSATSSSAKPTAPPPTSLPSWSMTPTCTSPTSSVETISWTLPPGKSACTEHSGWSHRYRIITTSRLSSAPTAAGWPSATAIPGSRLIESGIPASRILAVLAQWCGIEEAGEGSNLRVTDLLHLFRMEKVRRITMNDDSTAEH